MKIDKDTKLYGSFAVKAGNFGCVVHNAGFRHYGLNCIYKSFSVTSIESAITAMKTLNMSGAAVSMPYKIECLNYVETISPEAKKIGAANTIINDNGWLTAYNTDYIAAKKKLKSYEHDTLVILGNGGYAKAVAYAAELLNKNVQFLTRSNNTWATIPSLKNQLVFNCTPVENIPIDESNVFIDCLISTKSGQELSMIQAEEQFKLYTGLNFPHFLFSGEENEVRKT